ncbi:nuclease A inhibitor family protein [Nostoc sp. NMS8]|uniref:nuclease A inhibitor family protein n=1 Tax=Nostoc sp. NMS8 TaxID=2815392 RepID=UPI0025E9B6BB|nr:nuclease A inhibitor family protein [Nostoc sp. NMS8]MBN3961766.1 nuclease A inhibitor family protein [Nostoc sp. NMS8]
MTKTNSEILDQLRTAADGLLMMSESEYPFEIILWEGVAPPITPEIVLQQTDHDQDTPVEIVPIDDFFSTATTPQDWHEDEEKATVARFQTLVQTIKLSLKNPQVYRVGSIEIDAYIVGETPTGNLAGLATKVVET